ncbi:MAG TPA: hypothetical protein VG456_02185 [Candidatus Sulfopaludibacter sp.]|jgi:hypothetical protein|nr:hypothetical protein [Candidatus Sulfopaludibacter sp.]
MRRLAILAIACLPALCADWDDWKSWKFDEQETIKRSFDVPGTGRKLLVDNIIGSIHVTAYDGSQVQVSAQKHIYGRSAEAVQEAKRDIKLDMSQQGSFVRLYVDGPFRGSNGNTNYRGEQYYGYRVAIDYEIQVPRNIELDLRNITNEISVKGTTGDYQIHGLNGGIEMQDISGSGAVNTLNGKVKITFARNPEHDTQFHTLNGAMDVYFKEPLNADLHFKTLNGGVFTDFDVSPLPSTPPAGQNRNGMFYYRSDNRNGSARVGKGGPSLTFNGLNGAIRLHTKTL